MSYRKALLKKRCELIGMFPFVLLGKLCGIIFRLRTKHRHFLFFSNADIGGSIKVNAEITECIANEKPLVIFCKKPKNNKFLSLFEQHGVRIMDLHKYIDNKLFHFVNFFFRGVISSWINEVKMPVVFGGECIYFYKIIPHVKKETKTVELCHLNTWLAFSLGFIDDIDFRIFSTPKIKRDVERQYFANNLPKSYYDKLMFIDNKIDIPPLEIKPYSGTLRILYVGRGAPQKRVYLIAAIAKQMHEENLPVLFEFVGDVEQIIPEDVKRYCSLYGQITDVNELHKVYSNANVLILTSAYEGLPLVVMDMMARGKVILSTDVDGIPDYITNNVNGLLITEKEEDKIVAQGVELLKMLINHPNKIDELGMNAYSFAQNHFSKEVFDNAYKKLLSH
ncbi:MAG: glycosyltransferase family 4 protein [Arachidicoccus sp.]|nr:glycosyltransferase family 4 protein [Arachidicoccus sp.]